MGRIERSAWPLFLACALAALVGALLAFLWRRPAQPPPSHEIHTEAIRPAAGDDPPDSIRLPLERIDTLVAIDDESACALGGATVVCTEDGGVRWPLTGELPARAVAVARGSDGGYLVASDDGGIHSLSPGSPPVRVGDGIAASNPAGREQPSMVDAASRDGRLVLLAHRFDRPADPMRLPRVIQTVLYSVTSAGDVEALGEAKGFLGDRLLLQTDGGIVTFASVDTRAWRSTDGGRSFRRLPDSRRFGADFDGIQIAIERWADRLPGPGRPARPASALYASRDDGESWDPVFETTGETLVDFRDAEVGLVIAREEGTAYLTTDGARSFRALRHDDRLYEAVAVAHVGGRFIVATSDGSIVLLDPAGL